MTTGEKIKQLRKKLGMTQEELGNLIGVQKAAINKYETGIVVNLKQATIASLAKALHVSPVELLSPEDTPEDQPLTQEARKDIGLISPDEADLIKTYRLLPPPGKQYVHQQLLAARLIYGEKSAPLSAADK